MKFPRISAGALLDAAEEARVWGYDCIPVTVRIERKDGSVEDFDATGCRLSHNSGVVYVTAKER